MSGEAKGSTTKVGRLEVTVFHHTDGHTKLRLVGYLDGSAELRDLVDGVRGRLAIDLQGISFVNSLGVRSWVRMLRELAARGVPVTLQRCSEAMVMQLNMIREARTTVESFMCPYVCAGCKRRGPHTLEVGPSRAWLDKAEVPPVPCPDCGADMALDELPERYLAFLTQD